MSRPMFCLSISLIITNINPFNTNKFKVSLEAQFQVVLLELSPQLSTYIDVVPLSKGIGTSDKLIIHPIQAILIRHLPFWEPLANEF